MRVPSSARRPDCMGDEGRPKSSGTYDQSEQAIYSLLIDYLNSVHYVSDQSTLIKLRGFAGLRESTLVA